MLYRWNTIGTVFRSNTEISSFDEFVNFTGLTEVAALAFYASSLTKITLPPTVTKLGSSAFQSASSLSEIDLSSVQTLESSSLRGTKLTEVVLPASVTTIKERTFQDDSRLVKIIVLATTPPTISETTNFTNTRYWYVPASSLTAYQTASVWSSHADYILPIQE